MKCWHLLQSRHSDNIFSLSDKIIFGLYNSVHFKSIVRGGYGIPAASNMELIVTILNGWQP